jgi:deoxyribodipyrimidine photolyase-related protein
MPIGIWVLGNQLWMGQAALASATPGTPVILIESLSYVRQRPYHRQKLVLVWSAMRHFAEELRAAGWAVTYVRADDFEQPLRQWIQEHRLTTVRVMEPNDHPFTQMMTNMDLGCPLEVVPNNHFLWSTAQFSEWAGARKRLVLEDFYRLGRQRFDVLMVGDQPAGGQWNFDKQNRQPPKGKLNIPSPLRFEPDEMTRSVIQDVQNLDTRKDLPDSWCYGAIAPFDWGVTRTNALAVLDQFVNEYLPTFGPFQDAMVTGETTLWHSLISPYLNLGLLQPREVLAAVEAAYQEHNLALNSVEGFIRQVLGWREYMHGLYNHLPTDYAQANWFNHTEPLPAFYWDSTQTDMNCLHQVLKQVEAMGYAHHIQRLMVLSNFGLIVGVSPQALTDWFHAAFIDGYDWVMQTNVIGMGQFADGGTLATKPYAASANYINKMSDYCGSCRYNRNARTGENACPFNFFYWDFLDRHRDKLKAQGRINLVLGNLNRMDPEELHQIRGAAQTWRQRLSGQSRQRRDAPI